MANEMIVKPLELATIEPLLSKMDEALGQARKDTEELAVTPEQAEGMEYADLKRFRTELNRSRKACSDARIAFKNAWQAPMKQVETAFNAELSAMDTALQTFKVELDKRDEAFKADRWEELTNAYYELLENSGLTSLAVNVGVERIIEMKWLNRSNRKYLDELTEKVVGILKDYEAVNKGQWAAGLDEALRCFFETLDLRAVMDNDPKAYEAQLARHDLAVETNHEPEPELEPEQPQEVVEELSKVVETPKTYLVTVELTDQQRDLLIGYLRANDVHGTIKQVG